MDRIQEQASDLWELLFAKETAETYQSALNLTGKILTDTARLLWLIICSVFVFGAWLSDASVKTGNNIRTWVDQQGSSTTTGESKPLGETGKDVLDTSRTAIVKLLNRAREELGLEAEPISESPTKKAIMPTPSADSTPKVAAAEPTSSTAAPSASVSKPVAPSPSSATASSAAPTTTPKSTMVSASSTEDLSGDIDDEDDMDDDTEVEAWPPQTADD